MDNDPANLAFLWPEGKERALTFSYDDGHVHDRRLVGIFDRYGLRATFNLNSSLLAGAAHIPAEELPKLYARHEVAIHTVSHCFPSALPQERMVWEFLEDRRRLEAATGRIIRGMAYPYGNYSPNVLAVLPIVGVDYGRTTRSHGGFRLPANWLEWHPTCHDKHATPELLEQFLKTKYPAVDTLLSIWGHGYEFEQQGRWESFEAFCAAAAEHRDHVWFATNGEIFHYRRAVEALVFAADARRVWNPSAQAIWLKTGTSVVRIGPDETRDLE